MHQQQQQRAQQQQQQHPALSAAAPAAASSAVAHKGLHAHLASEQVQWLHFSFRWMSVLLMRELRLALILRLWDSYLSETGVSGAGGSGDSSAQLGMAQGAGFKNLHVYVCAAFVMHWKERLKQMDFQQIIQFLQKLPTGQSRRKCTAQRDALCQLM